MPSPLRQGERAWAKSNFPPSGHTLAGALQAYLGRSVTLRLTGPFLCHDERLYFPEPLHLWTASPLVPVPWLDPSDPYRYCFWDPIRPAPLVPPVESNQENQGDNGKVKKKTKKEEGGYLPFEALEAALQGKGWDLGQRVAGVLDEEVRPHNTLQPGQRQVRLEDGYFVETCLRLRPGWSLALAIEVLNLRTMEREPWPNQPANVVLRLGGEGHRALLAPCERLQQQWQRLQQLSQANFAKGGRVMAYLATPGVFIKQVEGRSMCRAWPWEWKLAEAGGPLVSVATGRPFPINGRLRVDAANGQQRMSLPAPQVFAAPPGSVYYLEQPAQLNQDQPELENGETNLLHCWRLLGYSELLWLPWAR